ncbi:MAG: MetQ/NlpA family ABC transporter substrate-binding protein [Komagataeibacter hansenii]|uniref:Lipoprotein n=2 Tax=Komagataeibacter saccharivorans TaxID=265959 RepID=A0A347WGC2_9PROT|nr:D-methionine-binding lipoprotein MetQ precursor [Komagataeibacter saccharivorans]MBL7236965.1 MetQ/NlpA family ABC transporter substrate-binding protein [Novacetimonas hansenii]PYD50878.1 metal ABC transporter substrate-binding protein [Komagataeibacter saccharivorans]QBL95099.1 D-methionine-binding lipoprotein MetQ [Komagataeibacter saccharivorans]GBQ40724.1 D-methionine transporter substrate-binding periplasmic protein [Komagataeibacter saccharivorans NRIC 0614]
MRVLSMNRRTLLHVLGGGALACAIPRARAADARRLRIGIMAGEDEDIWRKVAANAAKDGLTLEIVTFSDYNTPNEALSEHDIDANAFQHGPFLQAQIEARGYRIVAAGNTYFSPIGLYSSRWHAVSDLPKGAVIGLPNDPSNEGRALHLLQHLGLVSLSPDAGLLPTALDVTENPHDLNFRELDAGIVGRTLADLDAAIVNTNWAFKAGIDIEKQRIGEESLDNNPYVNFIAVNESDAHAPWVATLVNAVHQPDVRQAILSIYHGAVVPAWS